MKPIAAGLVVVAAATLLAADFSEARRLSGGRSLGAQRPGATQPAAPPAQAGSPAGATTSNAAPATPPGAGPASNPVMTPPAGANAAAKSAPTPATAAGAAPAKRSSWLGPVAGLAAGLGLAALAAHLGFSDELMSILLIAFAAMAVLFVVRLLMSRRGTMREPMPYAGAGAGLGTTPGGYETQVPPPARFEPTAFGGPPLDQTRTPLLPAGFDAPAFAREAKKQFLAVQAAHDRHDAKSLADVMTPELHREIMREMEASGAARPTEIVDVDAEVIDVATEGAKHWVSVRFSGTAREGGALEPFDEVWNLVKPVDGSSGWLIAGIQQQVMPS
ncbi:MAG: TIM44-like domain-containing protein [Vicinamibacteria bacterium]